MKLSKLIILLFVSQVAWSQDTLLTIDQAIKESIEKNYNVEIIKNEMEIAKINNNWATAGAYPTVSATANKSMGIQNLTQQLSNGTTTKRNGNSVGNTNAGLNINWVVFNGYKAMATKKRLEELERQGQFSFQSQVNTTVYDVLTAYYNIVRFNQQVKATDEQIKLSSDRLYIAEARFRIGTGAKNDVLQGQVDLNEQKAIKIALINNRELAINELNRLMRKETSARYAVADSILLEPMPDSAIVINKIDKQNPEILLARSNLAVLIQRRREINADRLPVVTFNGNYNFVKSKNSAGFNLLNQTYGPSAAIGVAIPLFNGGVIKRQLKVADLEYKNQEILIEQYRTDLNVRVANAFTNYRNALAIVDLERTNFEYLRENIFIATERFKKLTITSIELRQVQISYIAAQTRLYDALYRAKLAEAELRLLTGELAK